MTSDAPPTTRAALLAAARAELQERGESALSLRAVARRADLSHAAPAHFFRDKAGLLTAVATEGFAQLTTELEAVGPGAASDRVGALGRVYVEFGLRHPALMDLMFRGSQLHTEDAELVAAKQAAIGRLAQAVTATGSPNPGEWTLISWALVHGLVVLSREGAVAPLIGSDVDDAAAAASLVARYVTRVFASV